MTQTENFKLIESRIAEIDKKIIYLSSGGHITPAICILADHTKKMIRLHKLDQIANCIRLANKLLIESNDTEHREITAVFYHLFVSLQSTSARSEWKIIKKYIPQPLFNACYFKAARTISGNEKTAYKFT